MLSNIISSYANPEDTLLHLSIRPTLCCFQVSIRLYIDLA
jgi:hypothetical protein